MKYSIKQIEEGQKAHWSVFAEDNPLPLREFGSTVADQRAAQEDVIQRRLADLGIKPDDQVTTITWQQVIKAAVNDPRQVFPQATKVIGLSDAAFQKLAQQITKAGDAEIAQGLFCAKVIEAALAIVSPTYAGKAWKIHSKK